jgi:hypothetical protein
VISSVMISPMIWHDSVLGDGGDRHPSTGGLVGMTYEKSPASRMERQGLVIVLST